MNTNRNNTAQVIMSTITVVLIITVGAFLVTGSAADLLPAIGTVAQVIAGWFVWLWRALVETAAYFGTVAAHLFGWL